ncbi:hypothetical protein [Pseudoalteromonas luteoviolacea]|uniref:Polysaccharide deacetylase n=1 Tax=Pseudoalteromonas luteoviolacea (strain 2ta16) TaxID=1353533 RepID=V4HCK4_PSEL2|nr:hypothetical protein [Pseudoalteromonas luteoviolacea]ESP95186.1 hypothetical protein PL2TA16_04442 [Pseudoalteromonas luteoviolacea 2ta16]KZN42358.1 hypothetical protein N483_12615 [Pseudoalteromonas luteoviolacea NCIMB 1944]
MPSRIGVGLFFLLLLPIQSLAATWHPIDDHTTLIQPAKQASYLLPNQALIQGDKCAALVDSHGDFVAIELLIAQIRSKLTVPLCYVLATNLDLKQLSGVMLLQGAFPETVIYTASYGHENTQLNSALEQEIAHKLQGFEQSLQLSEKRIASAPKSAQLDWHAKLQQAKQRLARWRALKAPKITQIDKPLHLELGNFILHAKPLHGYKGHGLYIQTPSNGALYGGHTVNPLPYVAQSNTQAWHNTLRSIEQSEAFNWVLPSFGKPYKKSQLHLPIAFFELLNSAHTPQKLSELRQVYLKHNISSVQFNAYFEQALKQK